MSKWTDKFPKGEITGNITEKTVEFADEFGKHLGTDVRDGYKIDIAKLTTNQLRKFFGEVKRQQMNGYSKTDFVLLKPKLAYAVGRAKGKSKIKDFYEVMCVAIDTVTEEKHFKNFIKIFEAIVAYHKVAEEGKIKENN
jgi:CRISPR-associated protein Csm2